MNLLKKKECVEIEKGVKVIIPNAKHREKIYKFLSKNTKNGDIDLDSSKVNLYLFKELVISEYEDLDFKNMSLEDFEDCMDNPSFLMENIAYEIGSIVSDIIITVLKKSLLDLKITEMQLIQTEALSCIDGMGDMVNRIEKEKDFTVGEKMNRIEELSKEFTVSKNNKKGK